MSSVVILDSGSDSSISSEESYEEKGTDEDSHMYDILKMFFMNDKNENIATIFTNLTSEIKLLREKLEVK